MDTKVLIERIAAIQKRIDLAKRVIEVANDRFYSGGIFAISNGGQDYQVDADKEVVIEVALKIKGDLETELAVLEDAKVTADRVIAGLLPSTKTSA